MAEVAEKFQSASCEHADYTLQNLQASACPNPRGCLSLGRISLGEWHG